MSDVAIKIENVGKQYRLGLVTTGTLSHDLNRWWKTAILRQEDPYLKIGETNDRTTKGASDYVWALRDINMEIKKGDVVGIIGKNGAGKSTLLKLLSRVTTPTTGTIKAHGRIGSLLEVGTGFHPEMTGRENIYMNGAILGMSKQEITRKFDEIVDFSGCERYIDTPVKRYSSGMMVRLGFAVAAHLDPEILIVDEVLAVGDAEFQKKAIGKMQDVSKGEGRTVLFVSHNMASVQKLCNKGYLLQNGEVSCYGGISSVVDRYLSSIERHQKYVAAGKVLPVFVKSLSICDSLKICKNQFLHTESVCLDICMEILENLPETYLLISVLDKFDRIIFSAEKRISNNLVLEIGSNFLTRGIYSVQTIIYRPAVCVYEKVDRACCFEITDAGSEFSHLETFDYGCVFGSYNWQD